MITVARLPFVQGLRELSTPRPKLPTQPMACVGNIVLKIKIKNTVCFEDGLIFIILIIASSDVDIAS